MAEVVILVFFLFKLVEEIAEPFYASTSLLSLFSFLTRKEEQREQTFLLSHTFSFERCKSHLVLP